MKQKPLVPMEPLPVEVDNKIKIFFRKSTNYLALAPMLLLLTALIIYPLFTLLYGSLTTSPPRRLAFSLDALTLENYRVVFSDAYFWEALQNSLSAAFGGMIIAVIIGMWLAWLVARTNVVGKKIIEVAGIVPLFLPSFIGALAWSLLGGPRMGFINVFFRDLGIPIEINIYTLGGIMFVYGLYYSPYVFMFASSTLIRMDPSLEESSAICGANTPKTLFNVTFPLVMPALTNAAIMIFILMVEVFAVPSILGKPGGLEFVTTLIFRRVQHIPPRVNEAVTLGILLIGVTVILIVIQRVILGSRSYITVAGKGLRPKEVDLRWARIPAFLTAIVYIILAIVLPYIMLLQSALRDFVFIPSISHFFSTAVMSMSNINFVKSYVLVGVAFRNTFLLALICSVTGGVLYTAISYMINKTKIPGRQTLDYISMLPIAIAGLVMGMAYLWAWIAVPIGIYGTLWILGLAYISRFMPQGVRAISGSMVQIHPELEEASRISGATLVGTTRNILYPLIKPGVTSAMFLLVILCVRELSTSIFLYSRSSIVLSVLIYDLWDDGNWGPVCVLGLTLSIVLMLIVIIGKKVLKAEVLSAPTEEK